MLKKIEALRNEPKHVRNRYAFWTAASVTLCITLLWGVTLPNRLTPEDQTQVPEIAAESSFAKTLGDITQNFKATVTEFRSRIAYDQEDSKTEEIPKESTEPIPLDLEALVASSTERRIRELEIHASSSEETAATTSATTIKR